MFTNYLNNTGLPRPKRHGNVWLALLGVVGVLGLLAVFLLPAVRTARPAARRNQCLNNLKQIGIALHNYAAVHHALPPAYTVDADGKPLHSWRTLILPFMEENQLYNSIDLTKPWNDPVNAKAFNTQVRNYQCPEFDCPENHSAYLAIVAPGSCLRPAEPRKLDEITDGQAQTLVVIEVPAGKTVPWMSPQDAGEDAVLGFGPDTPLAHAYAGNGGLFVDGHARFIPSDMPEADRRALISIAGHDHAPADDH